jgi:hypothetical protein
MLAGHSAFHQPRQQIRISGRNTDLLLEHRVRPQHASLVLSDSRRNTLIGEQCVHVSTALLDAVDAPLFSLGNEWAERPCSVLHLVNPLGIVVEMGPVPNDQGVSGVYVLLSDSRRHAVRGSDGNLVALHLVDRVGDAQQEQEKQ